MPNMRLFIGIFANSCYTDHNIRCKEATMNELTLRIDAYFRSIALSASLDEAIRSTAEFLCRPVAIVDSALNHVGHAPDRLTGDGDWDTLITEGRVSPNYTEITRRNNESPCRRTCCTAASIPRKTVQKWKNTAAASPAAPCILAA